jgi:hypothetical protein
MFVLVVTGYRVLCVMMIYPVKKARINRNTREKAQSKERIWKFRTNLSIFFLTVNDC